MAVTQDVEGTVAEHRIEPLIVMVGIPTVHPFPVRTKVAGDEEVTPHPSEGVLTPWRRQMTASDQLVDELAMSRLDVSGWCSHAFFGSFSSVL
jgi:hypothetical protein